MKMAALHLPGGYFFVIEILSRLSAHTADPVFPDKRFLAARRAFYQLFRNFAPAQPFSDCD